MSGASAGEERAGPVSKKKRRWHRESMALGGSGELVSGQPDWAGVAVEAGEELCYAWAEKAWRAGSVEVRLAPAPFARGAVRAARYCQVRRAGHWQLQVAKEVREAEVAGRRDVELQMLCVDVARRYNQYSPPKPVRFLAASLLHTAAGLFSLEPYLAGQWQKHNNNFGYVSEDDRNTPQAFSHYSWEASSHTCIIVDIQGVGDHYTDPVVHSADWEGQATTGNMGPMGIQMFFETHQCNAICRYLRLPPNNPKIADKGTGAFNYSPSKNQKTFTQHSVPEVISPNHPDPDTPLLSEKPQQQKPCCTLL